jgi:hypothetical protein
MEWMLQKRQMKCLHLRKTLMQSQIREAKLDWIFFEGNCHVKFQAFNQKNRTIRILLSAIVDGLGEQKGRPELYKQRIWQRSTMERPCSLIPSWVKSSFLFKQWVSPNQTPKKFEMSAQAIVGFVMN